MAKLLTPASVVLELDADEAHTLALILYRIGGSKTTSRRRHATDVQQVLYDAGFKGGDDVNVSGNIMFEG